jgi:tetratricopeptide (TPR) repeat protein
MEARPVLRSSQILPRIILTTAALVVGIVLCGCDGGRAAAMQEVSDGVSLASRGEISMALRRFDAAVDLDPTNGYAHYYSGLLRLQELRSPGQAVGSLETASRLLPGESEVWYQLGSALSGAGRSQEGAAAFMRAVEVDSGHGRALHRLGDVAESEDRIRDAIDLYTRAIYADPDFPYSYAALAKVYATWDWPREALAVLNNGVQNGALADTRYASGHAALRAALGQLYLDAGEIDLAIQYFVEAVQVGPASDSHAFNLGLAYRARFERTGSSLDRERALEQLTRARTQCNTSNDAARCTSIAAALRDLRAGDGSDDR